MDNLFISTSEVKDSLGVSQSKAYQIIHELNAELKKKGFMVVSGRVSRRYFIERFYGMQAEEKEA